MDRVTRSHLCQRHQTINVGVLNDDALGSTPLCLRVFVILRTGTGRGPDGGDWWSIVKAYHLRLWRECTRFCGFLSTQHSIQPKYGEHEIRHKCCDTEDTDEPSCPLTRLAIQK